MNFLNIIFNNYYLFVFLCKFAFILPSRASDSKNETFENISDSSFDNFTSSFSVVNVTDIIQDANDSLLSINATSNNQSQPVTVITEVEDIDKTRNNFYFTLTDEEICTCDLNLNICDLNCCCDTDCTEEDVMVFTKCHTQVLVPDKNYCYQKDIIYRNNTIYMLVKEPESSLFCILHDNLKQHLRFKDLPALKSHRDLDTVLHYQSKNIYSWSSQAEKTEGKFLESKIGSQIFVHELSSRNPEYETVWKLPSSCFSKTCSCKEEIHYLEDFSSSCFTTISNLEKECETSTILSVKTYSNFCIDSKGGVATDTLLRLKDLITHTKVVAGNQSAANQNPTVCVKQNLSVPKYRKTEKICSNVVQGVTFTVYHNGYHGIQNISTSFKWIDVGSESKAILQDFKVIFKWDNASSGLIRSGNPGYQIGLPILIKHSNSTDIEGDQEILTVLSQDYRSICDGNRKEVLFGKNYLTSCYLQITKPDCRITQDIIDQTLLGNNPKQVFVGVFGNANRSNAEDWTEVYHNEQEMTSESKTCSFVTNLKINIAYSAVGTVNNPQYKILGVGYMFSKSEKLDLSCLPSCKKNLLLSTSVSFFDVSEPAVAHYPKAPVLRATLPSDFFYPFTSGCTCNNSFLQLVLVLVLCLISSLIF